MTEIIPIVKEDRNTFLAFKKHREKFLTMLEAGVFDVEYGQITVHMHNAQIQQIYINKMTFKREKEKEAAKASSLGV